MTPAATPALAAGSLVQVMLSLAVVLLAIFALAWIARRLPALRAGGGAVTVRGGVQVGPKERVVLIQAGDTWLLVGVAAGGVTRLHEFDQPPAAFLHADTGAEPPRFAHRLAELMARRESQ